MSNLADAVWGRFPPDVTRDRPVSNMLKAILVPGGLPKQLIYDPPVGDLNNPRTEARPLVSHKLYNPIVVSLELLVTDLEIKLAYEVLSYIF
tara:strand:- start:63 stop:338 length:276 start_codon:yes stop_codon:yes gene_type:complete